MSEESTGVSTPNVKGKGSFFRKLVWLIIIAAIIFGGYSVFQNQAKAVAIVNGEKITQGQYQKKFSQIQKYLESQGQSATSTEMAGLIGKQAIQDLVNETLLLQKAREEKIEADVGVVDAQLKQTKSQFPDDAAYQKALGDQGYTEASFRETIRLQNIVQQYLTSNIDMSLATTTAAEIKQFYDQSTAGGGTVPPLEEVRTQIEAELLRQKQQNLISQYIAGLTASSTIEILDGEDSE